MAKKKKHSKKKHKHKRNVANNTTAALKGEQNSRKNSAKEPKKAESSAPSEAITKKPKSAEGQAKQKSVEIQDVKYSLMLMAIIIAVFGVIYVLSMNESVSRSIYGLIKINY